MASTTDYSWNEDGILIEELTEEQVAAGGTCIVGAELPETHPGHQTGFACKIWVADSVGYAKGKYPFTNRLDSGLWEYVKPMTAPISYTRKYPVTTSMRTFSSDQYELFEPDEERSWYLPKGVPESRGITVLWPIGGIATDHCLHPGSDAFSVSCWNPANLLDLLCPKPERQVLIVTVFEGTVELFLGIAKISLQPGQRAYFNSRRPIMVNTINVVDDHAEGVLINY